MDEAEMAALESLNPMGKGVISRSGLFKIARDRIPEWGERIVALIGVMADKILKSL
jgi:hypothetical protein